MIDTPQVALAPAQSAAQQPVGPKPPKVAVIAVHGVGKHAAGEMQNAMADLLLSLPAGEYQAERTYRPFQATGLRIPLQKLKTGSPRRMLAALPKPFYKRSMFTEKSADFAVALPREAGVPPKVGEVGTEYTELLLKKYEGGADSNVYQTTCLTTQSADGSETHIYEVLWADLAKQDNSVISFFMALFQLLLHLGGLSRLAVDSGAAEAVHPLWTGFRWCQRWAVRTLQIFIPLLEILLFIALTSCFSSLASSTRGAIVVPILLGGLGAHLPFFAAIRKGWWKPALGWKLWSVLALLPGTLGSGLALLLAHLLSRPGMPGLGNDRAAGVMWWFTVGCGLLAWILSSYQEVRNGVKGAGWTMAALSFGLFCYTLHAAGATGTPLAAFWTAEVLLLLVRFCWSVLILLAAAAAFLGWAAHHWGWPDNPSDETEEQKSVRMARRMAEQARAAAARRTSRLALALPSVLFMLVTLLLWNGFTQLAAKEIQDPLFTPAVTSCALPGAFGWFNATHKGLLPIIPTFTGKSEEQRSSTPCTGPAYVVASAGAQTRATKADAGAAKQASSSGMAGTKSGEANGESYVANMLAWSVGYQLPLTLVLLGIAGFLMGWWALPSVLTERFPSRSEKEAPRWSTDAVSLHMGNWLSAGLDSTRLVTWLLWCSIFVLPAAYMAADWLHAMLRPGGLCGRDLPWLCSKLDWLLAILSSSTRVLVVNYAALATIILAALAKGGQTALSILLDVDTYMRASPEDATPRAKIFERYISTLRYVEAQKYDRVIIAAHSLGALISGDLLHFVHAKNAENLTSSSLDRIPPNTSLFTFGNPTRQLLNRFFPYLYDWIRPVPDNAVQPLPSPVPGEPSPQIAEDAMPLPEDLGVVHWASAYRSGDYVGRSMWLDGWFRRKRTGSGLGGLQIIRSADNDRAEACIGAGAHTHYMDDTAPEMAVMLDSLIRTGRI